MKNNSLVYLLIGSICLCSCTAYLSPAPKYGSTSGDFVANIKDPSSLLSVNSLLITPPVFDGDAKTQQGSEAVFYEALSNAFSSDVDMEIKSGNDVAAGFHVANTADCAQLTRTLGAQFKTDAVLCTSIHRYSERIGSSFGAEKQASLSFSIKMLKVADLSPVWEGDFVFKDQALSENIFRMKERESSPGWQSAKQALFRGFREASQDFARKRLAKFAPGSF